MYIDGVVCLAAEIAHLYELITDFSFENCPKLIPFPGSTSVVITTSTPSTTPAEEGGVVVRNQSRRKKILSSSRRRQSRTPSLETDGGGGEGEGGGRGSVPSTPDSTALGGDGSQVSESDTGTVHSPVSRTESVPETTPPRMQGAKVRLSGSYSVPLTVIEEPVGETEDNEQGEDEESERLRRFQRSPSPSLQVPPSPVRGFSPNSSPRNTRKKTRIATRRTRSNKCECKHKIVSVIGGNINEKTPCLVENCFLSR